MSERVLPRDHEGGHNSLLLSGKSLGRTRTTFATFAGEAADHTAPSAAPRPRQSTRVSHLFRFVSFPKSTRNVVHKKIIRNKQTPIPAPLVIPRDTEMVSLRVLGPGSI